MGGDQLIFGGGGESQGWNQQRLGAGAGAGVRDQEQITEAEEPGEASAESKEVVLDGRVD